VQALISSVGYWVAILKGEQYGKMELKYAKGWSLPECVTSSEGHKRPPPYWQILENMIIAPQFLKKLYWLPVRQHIHFKNVLITYKSINDMGPEYLCELVSKRKSSSVRYYCRCQCLRSSHMVNVLLVLQPPLCGIGCQHIFEMCHLLKILICSKNTSVQGCFHT